MLHDIQLSEPSVVKWVASSVYDMAKSILFREHEESTEETVHCFGRVDQCWPWRKSEYADSEQKGQTYNL